MWWSVVLLILTAFLVKGAEAPSASLVNVPAGALKPFWLQGSELMSVPAFASMAHPVTNADYLAFVKRHPKWRKSQVGSIFADQNYLSQFRSDLELKPGTSANSPVTFVSWFAARAYCAEQGMSLPATAQWEYMAAASEKQADASSDTAFLNRILEWYAEPKSAETLPQVQQRAPNYYGIYDLHGLVWEWTNDFNSIAVTGESREDGSLNRDLFCGAGGVGSGNKENYAAFMRFAFRSSLKGKSTAWNLGFRCIKEVRH